MAIAGHITVAGSHVIMRNAGITKFMVHSLAAIDEMSFRAGLFTGHFCITGSQCHHPWHCLHVTRDICRHKVAVHCLKR